MTDLELGMVAYRAYGDSVGNVNYLGNPMPTWGKLPTNIQVAWIDAAHAVGEDVHRQVRVRCGQREVERLSLRYRLAADGGQHGRLI